MEDNHIVHYVGKIPNLAGESYWAYRKFADSVWQNGVLAKQEKELIAVAVAHVTKCKYCIRLHTKKAKLAGVTLEQLTEAALVSASIEGVSQLVSQIENIDGNHLSAIAVKKAFPSHASQVQTFIHSIIQPVSMDRRLKTLIALAAAKASSSVLAEILQGKADDLEIHRDEVNEAFLIAAAMKAGGTVTYMSEMIEAFGERSEVKT
jgi:AhpD family alkylhydroperoxidase